MPCPALRLAKAIRPLSLLLLVALRMPAASPRADAFQAAEAIVAAIPSPEIPETTINLITHSGREPDFGGTHDFRDAIQAALDELAQRGGGTLLIPHVQGRNVWLFKNTVTYRIRGYLEIPSKTRLLIEPSVKLKFECSPRHYTRDGAGVLTRYEGTTVYGHSPLIRAFAAHDIVIEASPGNGAMPEIIGDGEAWLDWEKSTGLGPSVKIRDANNAGVPLVSRRAEYPGTYFRRPSMLQFFLCRNVRVEGIKFSDAPFWVVHPVFSENIILRGLLYDCQNINNDGVDVDSSRRVLIENVIFNNRDDNVVLKSGRDREGREGVDIRGTGLENLAISSPYLHDGRLGGPTEDVVVRRCAFKGHYALAVGSEMSGDVRRLYALDNLALHRVQMLFFVKSSRVRGGIVEDIHVHGIRAEDVAREVVALIPNYDGDTTSPHVPVFRNIHLSDITVQRAGRGISIQGWKEAPITGVTLRDITIGLVTGSDDAFQVSGVSDLRLEYTRAGSRSLDGTFNVPASAPRRQN